MKRLTRVFVLLDRVHRPESACRHVQVAGAVTADAKAEVGVELLADEQVMVRCGAVPGSGSGCQTRGGGCNNNQKRNSVIVETALAVETKVKLDRVHVASRSGALPKTDSEE